MGKGHRLDVVFHRHIPIHKPRHRTDLNSRQPTEGVVHPRREILVIQWEFRGLRLFCGLVCKSFVLNYLDLLRAIVLRVRYELKR